MRKSKSGSIVFSPTDLSRFYESEFASWMDHYQKFHTEDGTLQNVHRNPADPLQELLAQQGNSHETSVCSALAKGAKVVEISRELPPAERLSATLKAMESGAALIYQAALEGNSLSGYADILERREGKSRFGDYFYIPVDVKIASSPKPTAIIQLCAYADMLEHIQGTRPNEFSIITKDEVRHTFSVECFFYFYLYFKNRFLAFHSGFSKDAQPLPLKNGDHRDWSIYARSVLYKADDVSLTARIRQTHIACLKDAGITKLSQLAACKKTTIKGIPKEALAVLIKQADLQVRSQDKRPPLFEVVPHPPETRLGLAMLPKPHLKDIFFDMEGYPLLGKNGLEYMYGVAERGKKFVEFWAYSPEEEAKAFEKFVTWAYTRWEANPGMHIYHFAPYEPSTLKRLMGTYGLCEAQVNELLRHEVFVDLYAVVGQGLMVGTHSYGLKSIEALYYPERETEVSSGSESAVEFAKWLEYGDKKAPEKSEFLERIRKYNQDDCFSTHDLEAFLQKLKKQHKIAYVSLNEEPYVAKEEGLKADCSALAKKLLEQVPVEHRSLPLAETKPEYFVGTLLAHCLEFHQREDRPDWWLYFSQRDMTREDLARDPNALVGVKVVRHAGDLVFCTFQIEQDTKYRAGESVLILENEDPFERLKIEHWDILKGELTLEGKFDALPEGEFTLALAQSFIRKDSLLKGIMRHAEAFNPKAPLFNLSKAVYDLLLKKTPDIKGRKKSEPLLKGKTVNPETIAELVLGMNETSLCIQGPPGTGKTYTASRVIAKLLERGKRVAISSNSHKAINHLLSGAKKVCDENGVKARALKVTSADYAGAEEDYFEAFGVQLEISGPKALKALAHKPNLVGGTVYFLSKPELAEEFDYLFVDEATQVALPNLLAMGHCAKNIVLLGDQMQLEQPIKATHPGCSGHSALVHLTDGKPIVSADFGVFLPVTYRMHPDVCQVVSDCFYSSALSSFAATSNQKMVWASGKTGEIPATGVQFLPVSHVGNKHGSVEEAECIEGLVKAALKSKWIDHTGKTHPVTWNDILIVSPYNYQVALLQEKLGEEARVGSVDLFQGQEAPLVFVSLCASSGNEAPRGLSFLLNKNRLNVAISRAKCLAIVVGSAALGDASAGSLATMELLNVFHRVSGRKKAD